jgi:CBS domain-containing protein
MKQKVAADIAVSTKEYPHIPDTLTIAEAMTVLKVKQWESRTPEGRLVVPRSMLVFNEDLEFVGMVRRRDIMRGLLPGFLAHRRDGRHREAYAAVEIDSNVAELTELSYEKTTAEMKERGNRLIKEIMIPITTINHDDHLVKIMHQMVKTESGTSQLAVVKDGTVVGVIRSADVLHEVEQMLGVGED